MKLKLSSTGRLNRRYILLKAAGKESVEKAILDYLGVLGWAKASPFFVSEKGEEIVLAVNREELNNVRAAFELSREKIKVLRVSGTIKGLDK